MSLIITVYTNEGIVMSSDSRTTFNEQLLRPAPDGKGTIVTDKLGVHYSDTTYKTFLAPNNTGISTCGDATIAGKPVTGYIENFISTNVFPDTKVSETAQRIVEEFRKYTPVPNVVFHVAGYERNEGIAKQKFFRVLVAANQVTEINVTSQGAAWDGEAEILSRLLSPYWTKISMKDGTPQFRQHNPPSILWNFFSLQDAVDFSMYAMNTTIETMRFQERLKTVGKPIDILVIKPTKAFWIQRKELHA